MRVILSIILIQNYEKNDMKIQMEAGKSIHHNQQKMLSGCVRKIQSIHGMLLYIVE